MIVDQVIFGQMNFLSNECRSFKRDPLWWKVGVNFKSGRNFLNWAYPGMKYFIWYLLLLLIQKIYTSTLKWISPFRQNTPNNSLLLIGDFTYFINSCVILWGSLTLISQILHYWKYYKKESLSYLKHLKWSLVWFHQKVLVLWMEKISINQ